LTLKLIFEALAYPYDFRPIHRYLQACARFLQHLTGACLSVPGLDGAYHQKGSEKGRTPAHRHEKAQEARSFSCRPGCIGILPWPAPGLHRQRAAGGIPAPFGRRVIDCALSSRSICSLQKNKGTGITVENASSCSGGGAHLSLRAANSYRSRSVVVACRLSRFSPTFRFLMRGCRRAAGIPSSLLLY
jgi:hypothetical protein